MLTGCTLEAIYTKKKNIDFFCSIEIEEPRSNLYLYEVTFHNSLQQKLCNNNSTYKTLILKWNIKKSNKGLITAQNTSVSRYEIILLSKFYLVKKENSKTIYSDEVYSKAAHNVLEDELFSTITSERSADNLAANNLVEMVFNKLYLFFHNQKYEN